MFASQIARRSLHVAIVEWTAQKHRQVDL